MRFLGPVLAVVLSLGIAAVPVTSLAQFSTCVSAAVTSPPPPIPAYEQPPAPVPNDIWTPGYWAWNSYGYYWVPGVWVAPPVVGLYWTPGYWSFIGSGYVWSAGYWGPSVGFYGGINYGFGYFGVGFVGGFWAGNAFNYNTAVVNVNRSVIRNTYINRRVVNRTIVNRSRVSFNGGRGGLSARATRADLAAARAKRLGPTPLQTRLARVAGQNRNNLATFNHGRPPVTAMQKPVVVANRQPGFRPLTASDRQVAQRRALSGVHIPNTAVARTASSEHTGMLHSGPSREAPVSRERNAQGMFHAQAHPQGMTHAQAHPQGMIHGQPPRSTHGQPQGMIHGQPPGGMHGQPQGMIHGGSHSAPESAAHGQAPTTGSHQKQPPHMR